MAYNTSSLISRVQKRVKDTAFSSTDIREFLNDTQNSVFNEYDLRFMQESVDFTASPDDPDLTSGNGLPPDFVRVINIRNKTKGYTLSYIPFEQLDEQYPQHESQPSGTPHRWYLFGNNISLHPAPIEGDEFTLKYIRRAEELLSDPEIPEIPQEFAELLVYGAAYRIMEVKDNYDQAAILENKYLAEVQKLVNRYSIPQTAQAHIMKLGRR